MSTKKSSIEPWIWIEEYLILWSDFERCRPVDRPRERERIWSSNTEHLRYPRRSTRISETRRRRNLLERHVAWAKISNRDVWNRSERRSTGYCIHSARSGREENVRWSSNDLQGWDQPRWKQRERETRTSSAVTGEHEIDRLKGIRDGNELLQNHFC